MNNYFSGRYYKHQKDGNSVCLIVGTANHSEFIQIITNDKVWQYDSLAGCQISEKGLSVSLPEIQGQVQYGTFTPLCSDIMGPFRFLPMQCRHEVISMSHSLSGGFCIEGQQVDLNGGTGYIEGDRGRSFPKEYLWLHCNDFDKPCSIMVSVADIPFCGPHFTGCICAVYYNGQEYRLATYRGVKIIAASKDRVVLEQGRLRLEADIQSDRSHPLKAPKSGRMVNTIHESNCSRAHFRFWKDGILLFDLQSDNCSFECNLSKASRRSS